MADGILTNDISIESSWLCLFNGVISFFWFSHLKNCQVSPTEKIYIEPIYSQFTCLSDNLFRSEQFFMEQARDTVLTWTDNLLQMSLPISSVKIFAYTYAMELTDIQKKGCIQPWVGDVMSGPQKQ